MSVVGWFKARGPSGFGYNSTAEQVTRGLDLAGKNYLVTGCNSGIGLETARALSLRGGHVIAVARTVEKARAALAGTGGAPGTPLACDLAEPAAVRACVLAVRGLGRPLAAVIANAGIMALPRLEQRHGFELQFLTNHLGHFLLVTGLLEQLPPDGRVVMVASAAHRRATAEGIQFDNLDGHKGYGAFSAYGQSKLANILFARALAKRLSGARTANAIHPGVIATNLTRHMNPLLVGVLATTGPLWLKSAAQGAATQCYAATHPQMAAVTGAYLSDCNVAQPTPHGRDDGLAERLWTVSEQAAARLG